MYRCLCVCVCRYIELRLWQLRVKVLLATLRKKYFTPNLVLLPTNMCGLFVYPHLKTHICRIHLTNDFCNVGIQKVNKLLAMCIPSITDSYMLMCIRTHNELTKGQLISKEVFTVKLHIADIRYESIYNVGQGKLIYTLEKRIIKHFSKHFYSFMGTATEG